MIDRIFHLSESNTDFRTEILAGITTFLTMSYIIFLQPAVMSGCLFGFDTGMDFGAVMVATCVAAALATFIMGFYARYPIAQAPGMGENFFFVFSVIPAAAALPVVLAGEASAWQVALGVVFISGIAFFLLSITGVREMIINAISPNLRIAISVGIGMFIAFIGFQNAGVIIKDPSTGVKLNKFFSSPDLIIFFFGLLLTATLLARKIRAAILWGIAGATLLAIILKLLLPHICDVTQINVIKDSMLMTRFTLPEPGKNIINCLVDIPPSPLPTLMKMDIRHALSLTMLPFIMIFLFMDIFDTIGTLIGVSEQAGFMKDNRLPRANRVLLSDAVGTVAGACMGTSTVTSFIESTAGVEQGGRTGLTAVTVGVLFIAALFFSPLVNMIGSYPPITAPALVVVGGMMFKNIVKIDWKDLSESMPCFLIILGIPLSYSIADGLALGFICYPVIKLFSGRGGEVQWFAYLLAIVLLGYFLFVRVLV
ncbi:MAG: NCS2 family permease [Deltaproteobacteria bacterium]|nr:NCS2 family permease [Deltaproteobacteria bacterium]